MREREWYHESRMREIRLSGSRREDGAAFGCPALYSTAFASCLVLALDRVV